MTQIQIKIITLFVVGLLLGPSYHFYCSSFSGQLFSTNTLSKISDRWVLNDGSIFRISSGKSYQPKELPLAPTENDLVIKITCTSKSCEQLNKATLSLSSGSNVVFHETLAFGSIVPFGTFTTEPISKVYPEKYMILVEPKLETYSAPSIKLGVKKNIVSPSLILLSIGYGFCLLPFLFLLKTFRTRH